MVDYKKLYHLLFNKITDVIDELQKVQQLTEEIYIETCDDEPEFEEEDLDEE